MEEYKFSDVQEGFSDKLAIFDPVKMDTSILDHETVRHFPKAALSHGSPIVFRIDPNSAGYLDFSKSSMTVKMKITNDKDEKVKAADKVTLTNLPLSSVFSQLQVSLNNTEPNPDVGTLFGYKAYLEMLLTKSKDFKDSLGANRGFFSDSQGGVATTDPASVLKPNNGLNSRHALTSKGQSVTFTGPLGIDFLENSNRYLLNGVGVNLTFYPASDSFRLLAADETKRYKLVIQSMHISVCHVKVRPEMLIKHSQLLADQKEAMYAYPRVCMRSHIIAKGCNQFDVSQILADRLPSLLVVGFVDAESFAGKLSKNPFAFEHMDVNYLSLTVNSRSIPARPYEPDFDNDEFAEEYEALQSLTHGQGNGLTRKEFSTGNSLFVFNIQHHLDLEEGVYPIIKRGSTRLEVRFKNNLTSAAVAVLYMKTPGYFTVTNARSIKVEF